jgi:DNA-binding beta-propeller fold protein YncE
MTDEPIEPAAAPHDAPVDTALLEPQVADGDAALAPAMEPDAAIDDAAVLESQVTDGDAALAPAIESDEQRRRRRIRLLILALLLGATVVLVLFGAWYLLFRKPISVLPLPGISVEPVPHYSYSIYDVVAPTGIAVSPDGSRIYATQSEGDRQVIAFDAAGNPVASLKPPPDTGADHVPVYVAIHPKTGDVYVSDRAAATIYIYGADGTYLRAFDPGSELQGWAPLGMAFDGTGNLFVTSVGAPFQAVHEFGPDGTFIRTYGKADEFSFPNGVAADGNGNVYVSDSNNGRLVVFDRNGNKLAEIPRGVRDGDLALPRGAAIDDASRIYVADLTVQGVQIYQALASGESQPKFVGHFGEVGSADGQFRQPNAVAVDGRSRVYVADWRNNRIQVWTY